MFKNKIIAAIAVTSVFGLAACGGSSSDPKEGTVTTLLQKNAALPPTTMARTVTTPVPQLPGAGAPATTIARAGAPATTIAGAVPSVTPVPTTISRTVTTPVPKLPTRKK